MDLPGLNFVEMAYSSGNRKGFKGYASFDADIFYRNAPDIMLPHKIGWMTVFRGCNELIDVQSFQSTVLKGLPVTQEFLARYKMVALRSSEHEICMFATEEILEALQFPPAS